MLKRNSGLLQLDFVAGDEEETLMRPQVKGKFFFVGDEKLYIRGVTYGTFKPDKYGNEFHKPDVVEKDFSQMAANDINVVRVYTAPPKWLLNIALKYKLYVMIGLPWEQHITFLDNRKTAKSIGNRIRTMIREVAGHPAIFCYAIGNEIPASIVRWHGRRRIERYLKRLYLIAKKEDPDGLVTYVNYPTTEYLQLPFLDFQCFNIYLEEQDRLEAYLNRLHNIAGDLPLVIGEIGLDSCRNGEEKQAEVLKWQIRTVFRVGCAGAVVFGWTDEWHRGGHSIEDWDFGLTDRNRYPKKALHSVKKAFEEAPFPSDLPWPRISVVVCSYNGANTIRNCLESLQKLDYPNFEVILVNDGSTDDTVAIMKEYDFLLISTENQGLSKARNVGLEAATGEIVAYIDDDAFPDQHWLKYLAAKFMATDCAGVGGPNIAPGGNGKSAECFDKAPGGPNHILVSDEEAEHIPGCNMAFRRDCLKAVNGFDSKFKVAGDDVDICWRIQQSGHWLAFSPSAMVWHRPRNSIRAYWKQQLGYGKAEALLEQKWPQKYNNLGHINWKGRIYGPADRFLWKRWRIYYGTWGSSLFQSLYMPEATFLQSLPMMPELYIINTALILLSIFGLLWKPLLLALPILLVTAGMPLLSVIKGMFEASFTRRPLSIFERLNLRFLTGFLLVIQPLARLWGHLRQSLIPLRTPGAPDYAFHLKGIYEIWSENWHAPDRWLQSVKEALAKSDAIVKQGGDFDHWDLEVRRGFFGAKRLQMAVEEHGGGKQLVRFRSKTVIFPLGLMLVLLFAIPSAFAAMNQAWLVAALLFIVALWLSRWVYQDCANTNAVCRQVLCNIEDPQGLEGETEEGKEI